ncbi:MAG: Lrp/AsnC family transcriptional regulator [Promethearchaeota archaeon]
MVQKTELSDIQLKLIGLLSQNARAPIRRIASIMKLSEATVRYHISKLEESGVIKGYSVIIDPTKFQLPVFITIGVQCEPSLTSRVAETLASSPYFYLVWVVTGAHNIHAKAAFPSAEEMQRVVGEVMRQTTGILSYHLSLRFEAIKDPYLLPHELLAISHNKKSK